MQSTEHNHIEETIGLWRAEFLSKKFLVLYNKQLIPGQIVDVMTEVESKANAEKQAKGGKEPWKMEGPIFDCNAVVIEAENKEAAAVCARLKIGAVDSEGELSLIETTNVEKVTDKQ